MAYRITRVYGQDRHRPRGMNAYLYQGRCPATGQLLSLPRSPEAMAAARRLMETLEFPTEGKMLGVLLVDGAPMLKAFSGRGADREGWVPSIPCHSPLELSTLRELECLKRELLELRLDPTPIRLAEAEQLWAARDEQLRHRQRLARQQRDQQRHLPGAGPRLDEESRAAKREWRRHRAEREAALLPLRQRARLLQEQMLELKRQRRTHSAALQADLHRRLELFPGQGWSLASLFPAGPPTGTGECCAPKLLYQAARQGLRPLAMAEFWWGPSVGGRRSGEFYAACAQRCQPLIGPLLACQKRELTLLHVDDDIVAVDKPPGVLTLPGRASWSQDCLWRRLQAAFPEALPIHRLDLETTGLVLFARTKQAQSALARQFARRSVEKTYLARLQRPPANAGGELRLPLGRDPERPGCYRPDPNGKPAWTDYQRLEDDRVLFRPHTGRSHQLRVHAAAGLGCPIRGDRLYGDGDGPLRLHALRLRLEHQGRLLTLESQPPF